MKSEAVLCIPAVTLHESLTGFIPRGKLDESRQFSPPNLWFIPRTSCEADPRFKQIIPYIIVRNGDKIAMYTRTAKGSEDRLHNLVSIGVGGHVNVKDAYVGSDENVKFFPTIVRALVRELEEEVGLDYYKIKDINPIGYIYYPGDDVGKVHFGYVVEAWTSVDTFEDTEDALTGCTFVSISDLKNITDPMESWSELVRDYLIEQETKSE